MDEWDRFLQLADLEAGLRGLNPQSGLRVPGPESELAGGETWVLLAEAEAEAGVSRSALRAWYRSGQVPSRLVEGPHGPQRLVPLEAVIERARQSPRIQRRAVLASAGAARLEAEVAALRQQVADLEARLAALEARPT